MALDAANNPGNGAKPGGDSIAGNNINKVIHLFASGAERQGLRSKESSSAVSTNSCCLLCAGGGIVRTFYLCNLGICWAERGLDFSLLDLETRAPTSAYLFGSIAEILNRGDAIHPTKPPYNLLYNFFDEQHIPIDAKTLLRILLLSKEKSGLSSPFSIDNDIINALITFFSENRVCYINLPENLLETDLTNRLGISNFLLISKPDLKSIIQTFDLIKKASNIVKNSRFALILHRSSNENMVHPIYASLAHTVKIELGKSLELAGVFPDHQAIAQSVLERSPLALNPDFPELRSRFEEIANRLSEWMKKNTATIPGNNAVEERIALDENIGEGI